MTRIIPFLAFILVLLSKVYSQNPNIDHWEMVYPYEQPLKYWIQTEKPDTNWNMPAYNDELWPEFISLIGYGGFIQQIIDLGYFPDDLNLPQTTTFYLRTEFMIGDTGTIEQLMLSIAYEDAFVAYINGVEVARSNIGEPGDTSCHACLADSTFHHEADLLFVGPYSPGFVVDRSVLKKCLNIGTNILAVEVHNDEYNPEAHTYMAYMFAALKDNSSQFIPMDYYTNNFSYPVGFFPVGLKIDSTELPMVIIQTAGSIIPDEPKITARMRIIDNGINKYTHINDSAQYDGYIGIEMRGSSSLYNYAKKSYTVETRDSLGENLNVELLGLPAENDWVLYGPFGDKTLIRNILIYKLSQDLGHYAPRTRMVELIKNGFDQGIYVFAEKIKQDKNRVDIAGLRPDEITGDSLTGGYIIKIDKTEGNFDGWSSEFGDAVTANGRTFFQYVYPKYDEIVPEQKQYIRDFMHHFESVLRSDDFDDPAIGYSRVIDVSSFIDYLIINEVSKNMDGYRLSTFMYKDRDDNDGLLRMGPVWDYNLAFGNYTYCGADQISGYALDFTSVCPGDAYRVPFWWDRLLQDENFTLQLRERYDELRNTVFHIDSIYADIDSLLSMSAEARKRNFSIWFDLFTYPVWPIDIPWADSYEGEIAYLKSWIYNRLDWLDDNLGETRERKVYVEIENPEVTEYIPIGVYPNPFVGELSFSFELEMIHSVRIDIFNLNGQLIATPIQDELPAGSHVLHWDALNSAEHNLKPGIYLYRVIIDNSIMHIGKLVKEQ